MSDFTPILFEDGSSYSAQEVEWVCLDYLAAAERTLSTASPFPEPSVE